MKEFAETGETEAFDKQQSEDKDRNASSGALFDSFAAPPVEEGAGVSHAKLFVDGNHTLVSKFDAHTVSSHSQTDEEKS